LAGPSGPLWMQDQLSAPAGDVQSGSCF